MSPEKSIPRSVISLFAALAALTAACPSTPESGTGPMNGSTTAGAFGGGAGTSAIIDGAGMNGGTAGTGSVATARPTTGTTAMPCDVADIIKLRCQTCHGASPVAGPMALMSWEDTQAPSISDPSVTVFSRIAARVHDTARPMPPPAMGAAPTLLAADELAVLDAWIAGGAQAGTDPTCAPVAMDPDAGTVDLGEIPPGADHCYEIRAHANSTPGDTAPLVSTGEHYATFYFDAPWPAGSQGITFDTLLGDHPEILHHWLVYAEENGNQPDGKVDYPASGSHPNSPTLVAGWAPGADNNDIPPDVGLQLDAANRKMSLEIHFFGPEGMAVPTNAGVRICTAETPEKKRPNTATISWLGTELGINIPPRAANSTAVGTCTPQYTAGDIHILRSWPHMHLMGRKMESVIVRANGTEEPMNPPGGWDFDFNSEVSHKTDFILHVGDKVRTTCHYTNTTDNSIQVGFENRYEMCFNFTMAYPAKALVNKGFIGSSSLTNSATACLN